jgi:hypothetical protein
MYESRITKLIKNIKRGGIRKRTTEGKFDHSTLYAHMEISQ